MSRVKCDSTPPISPSPCQCCSLNNWQISKDDRNVLDMTPCSTSYSASNSKSTMELVKEITYLETEILQLELYLLSLYRTTFHESTLKKVNSNALSSGYHGHGQLSSHQISPAILNSSYKKERKTSRCSLGDHLGNTCTKNAHLDEPDRVSEDIIRCMSLIYCKLGDQNQSRFGPMGSSASSMSSSGTSCTPNISGTWSPFCSEEGRPYAGMVDVLKIKVDDDGFSYASRMLKKFRTLVKKLENVDPRKMKREQKLVFWINIHNALVMHAYLAYGTHNTTKNNSVLKATYNIGGQSINAHIIQVSILGIKSHFGATVRIYNSKTIFQDLRHAKEEYIRSTFYLNKETKICLPKILYYFAKDMALSMSSLLEMVNSCLPESQRFKVKKVSSKGKPEKCIHWLSQSCIFRYVIHPDTVEGRLSV